MHACDTCRPRSPPTPLFVFPPACTIILQPTPQPPAAYCNAPCLHAAAHTRARAHTVSPQHVSTCIHASLQVCVMVQAAAQPRTAAVSASPPSRRGLLLDGAARVTASSLATRPPPGCPSSSAARRTTGCPAQPGTCRQGRRGRGRRKWSRSACCVGYARVCRLVSVCGGAEHYTQYAAAHPAGRQAGAACVCWGLTGAACARACW